MKAVSESKKREIVEYAKANTYAKAAKKFGVHENSVGLWARQGKRQAAKKYLKARHPKGGTIEVDYSASVISSEAQIEDAVRWALFGYKEAMAKKS